MTEFTSGPWLWIKNPSYDDIFIYSEKTERHIATAANEQDNRANARLIAAAPTYHALLVNIDTTLSKRNFEWPYDNEIYEIHKAVKAAIALVEGESDD